MEKTADKQLRCIYCMEVLDVSCFNEEHVLHDSMFPFRPTLSIDPTKNVCCVCQECNQYFGDDMDRVLGRDSFEAILRFHYGLKSKAKLHELGATRVTLRIPAGYRDSGAKIRLRFVDGEQRGQYMAQLRVYNRRKQENEYLTADEFSRLKSSDYDLGKLAIIGDETKWRIQLVEKLSEILSGLGRKFELGEIREEEPETLNKIEISALFDITLKRVIAKIAFNYLSLALESISTTLIYGDDFNQIRNFIRYGQVPNFEAVTFSNRQLLVPSVVTDGHLVEVADGTRFGRQMYIAHVALFNEIGWQVVLADNYGGPHYSLASAHLWDFQNKRLTRLAEAKTYLSLT